MTPEKSFERAAPKAVPRGGKPKRKNGFQRHQPPSQTKFDAWLEQHLNSGETITCFFRYHPVSGVERIHIEEISVLTVDRYHLYLNVSGTPVWVAKDNIISAE